MSVRELKYQVKFLTHKNVLNYKRAICDFFLKLNYDKFEKHIEFGEVKPSLDEFNCDELQEMSLIITCSSIKKNFDFASYAKLIHKAWCEEATENVYLEWLLFENSYLSSSDFITSSSFRSKEITFGTLPKMKTYVQTHCFHQIYKGSKLVSSILCKFDHLQKEVTIFITNTHNLGCQSSGEMGYKIVFSYDSIIRILANMNSNSGEFELFLCLEYPPFIFLEVPGKIEQTVTKNRNNLQAFNKVTRTQEMEFFSTNFERTFEMGCSCDNTLWDSQYLGRNLVIKLIIEDEFQFRKNIEQMSLRCSKKTEISLTSVKVLKLKQINNKMNFKCFPQFICRASELNEVDKFNCVYAWSVVHSRSDVTLHQMYLKNQENPTFIKTFNKRLIYFVKTNLPAFIKSLYFIAELIDKGMIFEFLFVLEKKFLYFSDLVEVNKLPPGMNYVRRVIITPSRVLFLQPYENFNNRIIRKFGVEYMIRASVQDDNFSKLTFAVQYNSKKEQIMQKFVGNLLSTGITIGSRKYELLAASNSQLRSHGMWLYAKDMAGNTASDIRQWMGNFSNIKNVAKCMARMGQCLSSTETGVQILINKEEELPLEEITSEDGKYIFSDGIGIISSELAEEVRQMMLKNSAVSRQYLYKPVAFQIRYKGSKGMVVEWPIPGRILGIRPSMKKFECITSNSLEIIKASFPTKLFLNKHLITILEQMGVPKDVFMNLELDMIFHLLDSLTNEEEAAKMLTRTLSPVFPIKTLQKAGISLTSDPFFRSLLLAYFKSFAGKLKVNMRIAVPDEYGRNMLGVLDETKTLKYGQVFVQYSRSLTDPSAGFEILKGQVLVTKNPSLHPGDVRKLTAVDVPKLHHIKDCIVFPAMGKRPHPDEMAGSDLDGDEMVVLWYKPLIFSCKSAKPMDYPTYKDENKIEDIQVDDMVKFFCEYVQNDNIGTFAHAHLVWADRLENGIFSKKCMGIAKRYPYVLDFAKHGTTEFLKKSERPNYYPDFLQKGVRGNTYHSHKVLGLLYRTSRVLDACSSKISLACETSSHDPDLEYPGWESYKESAEMHKDEYDAKVLEILDRYCLTSEAEAFSGFIGLDAFKKWKQEKSDAVKIINNYLCTIIRHYRNIFLTEVRKECEDKKLKKEESLKKKYQRASAWYMVVYGKKTHRVNSFPWVLSDVLTDIKRERLKTKGVFNSETYSFIEDIDCDIKEWCLASGIESFEKDCFCNNILKKITYIWISKSGINIGNSDESSYCSKCYDRIFSLYKSKSSMSCCSNSDGKLCQCDKNCSPAKMLFDFVRFFILRIETSIGFCDTHSCNGFLAKNLQELALQTYSYLAITRNIFYLNIDYSCGNFTKNAICSSEFDCLFEEGDPIRIPANETLQYLIDNYIHDVAAYLKKASGVKDITLTPEKKSYLIVNSIGKNWQRWNLQEIVLDINFIENLKKNLNILEDS